MNAMICRNCSNELYWDKHFGWMHVHLFTPHGFLIKCIDAKPGIQLPAVWNAQR